MCLGSLGYMVAHVPGLVALAPSLVNGYMVTHWVADLLDKKVVMSKLQVAVHFELVGLGHQYFVVVHYNQEPFDYLQCIGLVDHLAWGMALVLEVPTLLHLAGQLFGVGSFGLDQEMHLMVEGNHTCHMIG